MKTTEVKLLVLEVLATMAKPYTEHVIEDVFLAVEATPKWRKEYDRLVDSLGKVVVNNWGGYWVANALGKVGEHQVASKRSHLIGSYSLLNTDAKTIAKKPKEAEAREMMAAYYRAHRSELPPEVRQHREAIIELIMEGLSPEQAFAMAAKSDA